MSRTIPAALQTHFAGAVITPALCAKVLRRDGTVLGFTSSTKALTFDSVTYQPGLTFDVSQLRTSEGAGVDNLDVDGLLQSEAITDADLLAGKYDDAEVTFFVLNYEDLTQLSMTLVTGTFGEATFEDGRFRLEFRSLVNYLGQQVGELTSHLCRVKNLFDYRCQANSSGFIFARNIVSVTSATVVTFGPDAAATGFYDYGTVEMRNGVNRSFVREIKSHTLSGGNAVLTLQDPFPFTLTAGETGVLTAGCDRTLATCISKFNNAINFQGEPHLPGTDKILRKGRRA